MRIIVVGIALVALSIGCGDKDSPNLSTDVGDTQQWLELDSAKQDCSPHCDDKVDIEKGLGDPCEKDSECPEGLTCREEEPCLDDWGPEDGRCLPPAELGECCLGWEDCAEGLVCDYPELMCFEVCLYPYGGPCEPSEGYGGWEIICAGAFPEFVSYCYEHKDGEALCLDAGLEDYVCAPEEYDVLGCTPDLVCDSDYHPPLCKPPKMVEGSHCQEDSHCEASLVCNQGYQPAVCLPPGEEGELCGGHNECQPGLICNHGHIPSICAPHSTEGGPCTSIWDCEPGLKCNPGYVPAICAAPGKEGDPCYYDSNCEPGLECDATQDPGVCVPQD